MINNPIRKYGPLVQAKFDVSKYGTSAKSKDCKNKAENNKPPININPKT